jgi:hypothetical protein
MSVNDGGLWAVAVSSHVYGHERSNAALVGAKVSVLRKLRGQASGEEPYLSRCPMKSWGPVLAFMAACVLALTGYIFFGLPGVGYAAVGFCLYVLAWAARQVVPELWASAKEDWERQRMWRQKRKGNLKWSK